MKFSAITLMLLASSLLLLGCLHDAKPAATTPTPVIITATPAPTSTPAPTVATATPEPTATPTPVARNEVRIKDYKFVPDRITVKKGETVVWVNDDTVGHTVTSDATIAGPNSPVISPGGAVDYTFNQKGIYTYHCSPHPYMKALVEVTE